MTATVAYWAHNPVPDGQVGSTPSSATNTRNEKGMYMKMLMKKKNFMVSAQRQAVVGTIVPTPANSINISNQGNDKDRCIS